MKPMKKWVKKTLIASLVCAAYSFGLTQIENKDVVLYGEKLMIAASLIIALAALFKANENNK